MLFKVLHGDPSRISEDITPFHAGHCYVTHDGYMYIDMNIGTQEAPNNQRIKLNAKDAETLLGASLSSILNESELEIPTSNAVLQGLAVKQNTIVGSIGDFVVIGADGNVTTKPIDVADTNAIRVTKQEFTDEEKAQARANIGAADEDQVQGVSVALGLDGNVVDIRTLIAKIEGRGGVDYTKNNLYTWDAENNRIESKISFADDGKRLLSGHKHPINTGDTVTVSAEVMFLDTTSVTTFFLGLEDQTKSFTYTSASGVWETFSYTFTANSETARADGARVVAQQYNSSDITVYIRRIQLSYADNVYDYISSGMVVAKLSEFEKRISELEQTEETNELPLIVGTDIGNKCAEFASLFNNTDKVESFLFFTDPHLAENDNYEAEMLQYLSAIKQYYDIAPTDFVICGGDWIGNSDTQAEACFKLSYLDAQMRSKFDRCYHAIGNHDTNYQGVTVEGAEAYSGTLTNSTIRNLMLRNEKHLYYSFDGANTKFYVLDTGTDLDSTMTAYRWEQIGWLADKLLTDDAEQSAIVLHIGYNSSYSQPLLSKNATALCKAYNDRTSITLNGTTYNFSNCTGKMKFVLCGHIHADHVLVADGLPIISTTNTRDGNTPSFDLCMVDYDANKMYMARVGTGSNRAISLIDGSVSDWTTDEPTIQYVLLRAMNRTGSNFYNNVKHRIMYVATQSEKITRQIGWSSSSTGVYPYDVPYYPISIPSGVTKVTVTCPANIQFDIEEWASETWDANGNRLYHSGWQQSGYVHTFSEGAGVFWVMFEDTNGTDTSTDTYDISGISVVME